MYRVRHGQQKMFNLLKKLLLTHVGLLKLQKLYELGSVSSATLIEPLANEVLFFQAPRQLRAERSSITKQLLKLL